MSEWAYTRIRDLLETSYAGDWGTTPLPGNARILRATDIDSDGRINGQGALRQISPATIQAKRLQSGDIMLEASGGSPEKPVGRVAFFFGEERATPFLTSNFYKTLRPSKNTNARFLHWALLRFYRQPEILQFQQQTTGIINLKFQDYLDASIYTPRSVKEQRLIARILDTLDTQIQQTEALIAKLEKVKEGLLHDLLTRGIDESGQLRPSPDQAPELYKESPLGLIPRDWEARPLGDSIEKVIDYRGRTPKKLGMDWGGDILALSANNVQPGAIDTSREAYFGGNRLYRRWMTNGDVKRSDVLLTMEAPLGNVARVPDDAKYIMSQRVIALRFKKEYALNDFSFWAMQSAEFQQAMKERSTGSTATGIQRAQLFKLYLKVPTLNEQDLIARKVFSLNSRLKKESGALVKLKKEKFGLMDDLLTGRVRVTPLLDTTQATTPA